MQENQPQNIKQGNCDLCGDWDGNLIEGACSCCNERYGLTPQADVLVQLYFQKNGRGEFSLFGRPVPFSQAQEMLFAMQVSQANWYRVTDQTYFANSRYLIKPINSCLPVNTHQVAA